MRFNWTYILHRHSWRKGTSDERRFIEIKYALARTLRAKRRARGFTQARLAKRIGAAQQTISKVERASAHVTIDYFVRAMIALGATDAEIAAAFNAESDNGLKQLRDRGRLQALRPRDYRITNPQAWLESMKRLFAVLAVLVSAHPLAAQLPPNSKFYPPQQWQAVARDIYKQLIEINTTDSSGDNTAAANAMAQRLKDAGFPPGDVQVLAPAPRKGNLVARLRGRSSSLKPLLLLAHLDVVEARREDWSMDPFVLTERDGYFYGRGTTDDKPMAAIFVANLMRMKKEGIVPNRDIILALTADEEGGDYNGVSWLIANHRDLVDAAFALNEGGGGEQLNDKRLLNAMQASEKVYLSFHAEVTNPGGHSSRPSKDNAIYHLANALSRLAQFDFPVQLNDVTRAYFERMSKIESGQLAADMAAVARGDAAAQARLSEQPYYNALMRTTCVATMLQAGHAENALPQMARATINCRILPGKSADDVEQTLTRVLADDQIKLTRIAPPKPSDPSPLTPEIMNAMERVTNEMWPGVPVVPVMGTGATDGLYFRQAGVPTYGLGPFEDINDSRAHGRDERLPVQSFYEGQEFLWRLVNVLAH